MGMPQRLWMTLAAVLAGSSLGLAGVLPASAATRPDWRIVFSHHYPQSNGADSAYGAVVAPGRNDVWALGGSQLASNGGYPVAERWNGRRWRAAALPPGFHGWIAAASASSPANIWAVSVYNGYVLHWDGSRWRVAKRFKETSYPSALTGVTAISRTDVWVFGGVITRVMPLVGFGTCQLPHPRHLRTAWLTLARWTAPQATPGARATSTEQPASSRTAWPWILTGSHCGGSGASSS